MCEAILCSLHQGHPVSSTFHIYLEKRKPSHHHRPFLLILYTQKLANKDHIIAFPFQSIHNKRHCFLNKSNEVSVWQPNLEMSTKIIETTLLYMLLFSPNFMQWVFVIFIIQKIQDWEKKIQIANQAMFIWRVRLADSRVRSNQWNGKNCSSGVNKLKFKSRFCHSTLISDTQSFLLLNGNNNANISE